MLFNKNNNGAAEIKAMIGWIYKSNSFANISTYVKMAERDIIRLIGEKVYNLAKEHYEGEDYEADDQTSALALMDELVHSIQLPVALHAYRRYAPGVDLQHSEAGRQITVTAELKPAFEWMIHRDNRNIMDLAHETTDMLLEFLDKQLIPVLTPVPDGEEGEPVEEVNEIGTIWGASAEYIATKSLLINSAIEFDKVFPINSSRRLYLSLVPFIREVELRHIQPALLSTRYEAIKEKIRDNDLEAEDEAILQLARVPIALLTMSIALKRLSMEVLPDSIVQNISTMDAKQSLTADSTDRRALAALLEQDGRRELIPLQSFIASLSPSETEAETETDTTQPFFMA